MLLFFCCFYTTLSYLAIFSLVNGILYLKIGAYMKPLKSKVRITLDEDLIQQIKKLADNDERSFSQYINMVLKEHVSQKNRKIIA